MKSSYSTLFRRLSRLVLLGAICGLIHASALSAVAVQNGAPAQGAPVTIAGMVYNLTTGQPAAGDAVVLLRFPANQGNTANPGGAPAAGRETEEARTTTDAQGAFSLQVPPGRGGSPSMIRAIHQDVGYDQQLIGGGPVRLIVFDAVEKVELLAGKAGIMQLQTDGSTLYVRELYAIENDSKPPRTQHNPQNFVMDLPAGAVMEGASVTAQAGATSSVPLPKAATGRLVFDFPLRPGETRYVISYHLPYSGKVVFHPKVAYPLRNFAVMIPPSMVLTPMKSGSFHQARNAAGESPMKGVQIEIATMSASGELPAFTLSGGGGLPPPGEQAQAMAPPLVSAPPPVRHPSDTRPAQSPNKAATELWLLLAGIVMIVVGGGFWLWRARKNPAAFANKELTEIPPAPDSREPEALKLDALKEDLFRLENERLSGKISEEEYASSKRVLQQNIERVLNGAAPTAEAKSGATPMEHRS